MPKKASSKRTDKPIKRGRYVDLASSQFEVKLLKGLRWYFSLIVFCILAGSALLVMIFALVIDKLNWLHRVKDTLLIIGLLGASLIIGTVIAVILSREVLRPINTLSSAMRRVAEGDFAVKLNENTSLRFVHQLNSDFNNMVGEMIALMNGGNCSDLAVRRALAHSTLLSADVAAAFDPNYPSVGDNANFAAIGQGIAMVKYTGSRGKSGANDAAAELVGKVRKLFNDHGVVYQTSELGKVDQGGGGTIAYIMANYDMDVIDAGVAMLSMHAPWEIVSKADVYMTSRAYHEFFVNYR